MGKHKSFVDIAIVGAGNSVTAVFGLLFFTAVARSLPIDEFGKYALLTALLISLTKIMDFGTNSIFVAKSITKRGDYVNKLISTRILLFFITLAAATGFLFFSHLLKPVSLILFIIGTVGYGINMTLFAFFQRLEKFVLAITLNIIPATIKAITALLMFTGLITLNLDQAFGVFAVSILFSAILTLYLPEQYLKIEFTKNIREMVRDSFSAGLALFIKEFWLALTSYVIKIFKTFSDVGIFSLANKIADIFSLVSLSIFTVLLPKNAKRKINLEKYNINESILLTIGVAVLAVIFIVAAKFTVVPVFGEKFADSLSIINILIVASAITAIHTFLDNFYFIENKTNTLLAINGTKLAIFLVLAFFAKGNLIQTAYANLAAACSALILSWGIVIYNNRM